MSCFLFRGCPRGGRLWERPSLDLLGPWFLVAENGDLPLLLHMTYKVGSGVSVEPIWV